MPRLIDAHLGLLAGQSAQIRLPSIFMTFFRAALRRFWSCAMVARVQGQEGRGALLSQYIFCWRQ